MSIQFKSIVELRAMLDEKSISTSELIQESFELAKKYKELNCFITMNEESGAKKANAIDQNDGSHPPPLHRHQFFYLIR